MKSYGNLIVNFSLRQAQPPKWDNFYQSYFPEISHRDSIDSLRGI